MRDAGRVVAVAALVATVALVVGFHVAHAQALQLNAAVAFYVACAGILIWFLALASRREPWRDFEPAAGRVVAIVPAYNEDPAALKACLDALLSGSYVPDSVHVVDDGSDPPLEPYRHGLVTWHRHQQNQGKRWAQLNAVRDETDADFVVTLDSDSVPHKHALRECLRALSDPEIQAATAVVAVRNRRHSWLTRLVDLELVYGCLVQRAARSSLGAVAPTSGAFAVYRASIIRENLVDYVLSGTAGDDRRLTEYALLRGRVVGCSAAWVQTDMPETFIQTFRQRVRWYKSYFLYLRWELVHLSGWPFRLRVWSLAMTLLFPILLAWALIVVPLSAGTLYWQPFAYWVALMYGQTAGYAANRPGMHVVSRTAAWLLLTPLLIPWSLILVKPALYRAIPAARDFSWQTR
jgi:hyaluronan synthase